MNPRWLVIGLLILGFTSVVHASCLLPDDGTGTVKLPPDCLPDGYLGDLRLLEGLPPGSTVQMDASISDFSSTQTPGGTLGGTIETFTATIHLDVVGAGTLTGFQRTLSFPVNGEMHVAPHPVGTPVQSFLMTMYRLRGKLVGDYDFRLLEFEGGDVYGLDSPGQVFLTRQGGPGSDYQVESFFDYNYRIQFEGQQESQWIESWRGITLDLQSTFELDTQPVASPVGDATRWSLVAWPNPLTSSTELRLTVPAEDTVERIAIYDVRGRRVRVLTPSRSTAAAVGWDGQDDAGRPAPSGVYFARAWGRRGLVTLRLAVLR